MRSLFALALTLVAPAALADFNFATFPNANGLSLVGAASINGGATLRLNAAAANSVGAAWHTTPQAVADGFTTTFNFRIHTLAGGGADGFAFVIQNSAVNAVGLGGCRIGYHDMPNSVVVEFDTFQSGTCDAGTVNDPNGNHVSIHTRGQQPNSAEEAASIGINTTLGSLSNGSVQTCKVTYVPGVGGGNGVMSVFVGDMTTPKITASINLATTLALNQGRAWVGFTGATGGSTEIHDIQAWSFTEGAPAQPNNPRTPIITEPTFDGRVVNPADVHMETDVFFSPIGATHRCTDWEIWTVTPSEVVWRAACLTGVERLHTHIGDGVFLNSHAGRAEFLPSTNYTLRVRHRDDTSSATEYSAWAQRPFSTGTITSNLPMSIEDVTLPPRWTIASTGAPVELPNASTPPRLRLESGHGDLLVELAASAGGHVITNPAALTEHVEVRAHFIAGSSPLSLPATNLAVVNEHCTTKTIYLPAVNLAANQHAYYWASAAGNTYTGTAAQDHADFTTLARGSEMPFLATEHGYAVEKFATGFQLPVNIAFVPNPGPNPTDVFCYVTELYGTIKMVTRDGTLSDYRTGLINFNPTGAFPGSGEQGLAGICVDPTNGDVYATVLMDDGTGNHYPRVIRLQSNDGGRTAATVTTILNMPADPQGQSHQISNISFGPDGMLYVHNGDGFVASTAQDLTRFRGKILRMTKAGAAPTDNPFYNATDGISARDYVWSYGVRNPFGGAWRLADNLHVIIENGPTVDRLAKMVRGRNFAYTGSDASMANFAIYNWNPSRGPVNGVFIQNEVFNASGFPADKHGKLFVTESGPTYATGPQVLGKRIVEFGVSAGANETDQGSLTSGPGTVLEYAGAGKGSIVGLAAGPNGLYFTDLYKDLGAASPIERGASLYRLYYAGETGVCCSSDFNGDGDYGTDQDIEAFFACLGGTCCATCQGADFNHDGDIGTDQDIESFFRVLGGGSC
ncbi:MAG TPA: PQQ-dependent sugar dehydrogenase [Phycisphaerales bacterium]|nr:PQQ-dependent sugar dehydrogenase [Phycisphaerales bacterium]